MERVGVFIDHENVRIRLSELAGKFDVYEDGFIDKLKNLLESKGYSNYKIFAYDNYLHNYFNKKDIQNQYKANGITPIHSLNIKDSVDMDMGLDALEKCIKNELDVFVIVSSDKDMFPLIRKLKDFSKKVYLVGITFNTSNFVIKQADGFIPIEEIMGITYDSDHFIKSDIVKATKRCKNLYNWSVEKGKDLGKDFTIHKVKETLYSDHVYTSELIEKLISNNILEEYDYTFKDETVTGLKFIENQDSTDILNGKSPNFC